MAQTGKCILGIMFTTDTDQATSTRLTERFGPNLLHAEVGAPAMEAEKFYECVRFKLVTEQHEAREAKVFIAETGRWANLKLRFLPDEIEELKIRSRNLGQCAVERADKIREGLVAEKEKAEQLVKGKMELRAGAIEKLEQHSQKLQEAGCLRGTLVSVYIVLQEGGSVLI